MKILSLALTIVLLAFPAFAQSTLYSNSTTGMVGVGTTTPQSMLQVYGGEVQVGSSGASCATANNGAIRFSGTTLYYCSGTTWTSVGTGGSGTVSSGTAGQVAYYQSNGTTVIGTSTLNISGGKVGIGTATPANQLDVAGSSAFGTFAGTAAGASNTLIVGGHVGIGTTDPVGVLHVSGIPGGVYFTNTDFVNMVAGSGLYLATGAPSGNTYTELQAFQTGNVGAGSNLILQPTGGNVGIGTSTPPSFTLQVDGSVAGTSAYVNTSDARYKKNVQPLDRGLDAVMLLKPVSFEWKDEVLNHGNDLTSAKAGTSKEKHPPRALDPSMRGQQMGFVAQDVEKILPSVVVTEGDEEKSKGMKYSELIPVLVKAVQEQQAQLVKDEATIAAMKSKLGM